MICECSLSTYIIFLLLSLSCYPIWSKFKFWLTNFWSDQLCRRQALSLQSHQAGWISKDCNYLISVMLTPNSTLIHTLFTCSKWNMCHTLFICTMYIYHTELFEIHSCAKEVIFGTEFVFLCKNPPFYQVNLLRMQELQKCFF